MLATEQIPEAEPKPRLEEHAANEAMRHIPSLAWMTDKLDGDLRRRIDKVCAAVEPRMNAEAENEMRALSRALDRLADAAKHVRNNGHGPNDPLQKVRCSLNHALSCLWLVDAAMFVCPRPFLLFE